MGKGIPGRQAGGQHTKDTEAGQCREGRSRYGAQSVQGNRGDMQKAWCC